jgi:hypothetical protein
MTGKRSLWVTAIIAFVSIPLMAECCRGDFEDRLLEKVRQRREAEALDVKREVSDALAKAEELASSAPDRALTLLQGSLARLRADELLPRDERRVLIRQVEQRLQPLKERVAAKAREAAPEPTPPAPRERRERPRPGNAPPVAKQANGPRPFGQPADAEPPPRPAQGGGRRFVRVSVNGIFTSPPIFSSAVTSAVVVPDRGTAVVGGYSSLVEGRNEFGPPGLSQTPYLSRLFRNVGYGRQPRYVRLLVGVRIISMQEEEERFLSQGSSE